METINITVKVPKLGVLEFRRFLDEHLEVVKFKILPNTEKMYQEDETFKSMIKEQQKYNKLVSKYINNNNNKYENK